MPRPKYIVENGVPECVPNCNTTEDLQRYLNKVPHFEYRLVGAQFANGNFVMVWELRKELEHSCRKTEPRKKERV